MKRKIFSIMFALMLLLSLSFVAAVPAAATDTAILDFDSLPTGSFTEHNEDGFSIKWIGYGDYQTISDVAGNHVLKDPAPNGNGAEVVINTLDGSPFYFNSLDYNNFESNSGSYTIRIRLWPYPFSWESVADINLNPDSSTYSTLTSTALGVESIKLSQMWVNINSGTADYSVDNINLTVVTKADILKGSNVPGKGLDNAPGLQKPYNPNSKAVDNAGKK
ncbi:hypothetical protein ACFLWH_02290 [Chloroflexota bacterium]